LQGWLVIAALSGTPRVNPPAFFLAYKHGARLPKLTHEEKQQQLLKGIRPVGNDTLKKPITKQAVYERLSKQLDNMDKAHNNKPLKVIKRAIIKAFNLKRIPEKNDVYSAKHYSLLKRVEKMEADMIKEGNK
jgi:hypothetical protein